jgi:hypothetical protein
MSKFKIIILLFAFTLNANANKLLYRVQVGTYAKGETPKQISEMPGITTFTLPEGYNSYFSGGYYPNYMGCKIRLASVKRYGIDNAVIRVFKNGKLLSLENGQEYIAQEEDKIAKGKIDEETLTLQIYNLDKKNTMKNRQVLFLEIGKEPIPDSVLLVLRVKALEKKTLKDRFSSMMDFSKGKNKEQEQKFIMKAEKLDNPVEIKELDQLTVKEEAKQTNNTNIYKYDKLKIEEDKKKEQQRKKEEDKNTKILEQEVKADIEVANQLAEEILAKSEERLEEADPDYSPNDLPFYKVYLLSNLKNGIVPQKVEELQEIIYVYDKQKLLIYTVGYFATVEEAEKEVPKYLKKGFDKADVVGIYRAMVISKEAAEFVTKQSLGKK